MWGQLLWARRRPRYNHNRFEMYKHPPSCAETPMPRGGTGELPPTHPGKERGLTCVPRTGSQCPSRHKSLSISISLYLLLVFGSLDRGMREREMIEIKMETR